MKSYANLFGIILFILLNKAQNYYIIYDGEPVLPSLDCQDFEQLLLTSTVFVDKTLLIEEFLNSTNCTQTQIIVRPPGWGKTLNMDMMRRYFEIQLDHNGYPRPHVNPNKKLFFGGKVEYEGRRKRFNVLKISANKKLAQQYLGKHPVIVLKLGKVHGQTYRDMFDDWFAPKIRHLFHNEYGFLRKYTEDDNPFVSVSLKERLKRYYAEEPLDIDDLEMSLNTLVRALYHHLNGTTVFVFIDQFDDPFVYSYEHFELEEHYKFYAIIMNFFWNTFELIESRSCIEKGLLTGVFPMILNTNDTDLDDPSIYTIMNVDVHSMMEKPEKYSPYYGFYENEVKLMMRKTQSTVPHHLLKKWYNGFNYTKHYVYNPISTNECLRRNKLDIYWYNFTRLSVVTKTANAFTIQLMLLMIVQGKFTTSVYTFLNYDDFSREHGKVSTMLHAGLFSVVENERLEFADCGTETLMLPNIETQLILQRYTVTWTCMMYKLDESLLYSLLKKFRQPFTEAMLHFQENEFIRLVQDFLESFPVSFTHRKEAQQFYIWVLLYLFVCDDRSGHMIKRYKYDFDYAAGPKASETAIVQAPLRLNKSAILLVRTEDYWHPYELIIELKFLFNYIKTLAVYEIVFYGKNKAKVMCHLEQQRRRNDGKMRWSNLTLLSTTNLTIVRTRVSATARTVTVPTSKPSTESTITEELRTTIEDSSNMDDYTTPFTVTNNDKKDIVDVKEDEPVKKTRTVFKWYQLRMLEQAYNLTQHPNKYVVKDLSNKLNITEKVIKTWFYHERKRRKQP